LHKNRTFAEETKIISYKQMKRVITSLRTGSCFDRKFQTLQ